MECFDYHKILKSNLPRPEENGGQSVTLPKIRVLQNLSWKDEKAQKD